MRIELSREEVLIQKLTQKPKLIEGIEERLKRDGRLGINIGIQEGLILKSLCSQEYIKKVVEIGTQYGCSASWMAMGLAEGGKIYSFEKDPETAEEARKSFMEPEFKNLGCQMQLFEGAALELLPTIEEDGPFDLVFIDANKVGYLDYFNWARKNVRSGGLIVADNVYLFGTMFEEECPENTPKKMWMVMREMLQQAFQDPQLDSFFIPTQEGLLVCTKK